MNRGILFLAVIIAAISLLAVSCIEIEKLPPEPRIEFISFTVSDTTDILGNTGKAGKLKFYFEDGDGDIGLNESPTSTDESRNLFLTLYRKVDGVMTPALEGDPLLPTPYRKPYIETLGQNKIVKGEITVVLLYLDFGPEDVIMYDFYIQDRAKHLSNVESTCEIAINSNGTCLAEENR
jgi:hypothetical protein